MGLLDHRNIRAEITSDRFQRRESTFERRMAYIHKRDELHTKLNEQYGFVGVGSGKKSHVIPEYVRIYDEIERVYMAKYEELCATDARRDKDSLTVYEYMLFDSISEGATGEVLKLAAANSEDSSEYLRASARGEVSEWKTNARDAKAMMRHKAIQLSFIAMRCRKFLGLRVLDPTALIAIRGYRKSYMQALEAALSLDEQVYGEYMQAVRHERASSSRFMLTFDHMDYRRLRYFPASNLGAKANRHSARHRYGTADNHLYILPARLRSHP